MTVRRVEADVCVVGAGLAGLTAARRLVQAGRSVVVVEARDRVGDDVGGGVPGGPAVHAVGGVEVRQRRVQAGAAAPEKPESLFPAEVKADLKSKREELAALEKAPPVMSACM